MIEVGGLLNWGKRRLPLVLQTEVAECGLACLAMVAGYHGSQLDMATLRRRLGTSMKGTSLTRLMDMASELELDARALRCDLPSLRHAKTPCILHWNMSHFVVLKRWRSNGVEIHDPSKGVRLVLWDELNTSFTGILLELSPKPDFRTSEPSRRISLRALAGHVSGVKSVALQMLGLALIIEFLSLLLPFQMQWVMDQILISQDTSLLVIVTAAFAATIAVQTGLACASSWLISWFGATLNAQWTRNLFSHLMRLPVEYFEKRHMGDVVSRFSSIRMVQNTLTGSFIETLLSGITGLITLVVLCIYSLQLTSVVVFVLFAYCALRAAFYRSLWRINEEQMVYSARQQSELMESVRGVQTIKLAGKHGVRLSRFTHVTLEAAERDMWSQRLSMLLTAVNQSLFGLQRIVLVSLGAYMTIKAHMSAGMLVAFVAYADQFTTKASTLIDRLVGIRMLRLQFERIADIALEAPEATGPLSPSVERPRASLEVVNLCFRYSDGDPWIFKNLSFSVDEGQSIALVGPSGCGKTTLAKVLLGLLRPTSGTVLVGGIDIYQYGILNYREMVSAVMQDDQLFAGSIAENIAFFDDSARMDRIERAARMAAVHEDIRDMTMGYESHVGDMGSALSGGQKQRIVLARALYRASNILVLDEATSHLDVARERQINANLEGTPYTKIVIAHRPDTIALCDRVFDLRLQRQQFASVGESRRDEFVE